MPEPVSVRGEAVLLRPFEDDDLPAVEAAATDPLIRQWNPIGPAASEWCARRSDWSAGDHASWAIADPETSEIAWGAISLHKIDLDQRDCEVGFLVFPAHRGRGVASAALSAAVNFAFTELALHRVYLFHAVANAGSCAVARSAGLRLEGVHRESFRYGDGVWQDEHSHAVLRSEAGLTAGE